MSRERSKYSRMRPRQGDCTALSMCCHRAREACRLFWKSLLPWGGEYSLKFKFQLISYQDLAIHPSSRCRCQVRSLNMPCRRLIFNEDHTKIAKWLWPQVSARERRRHETSGLWRGLRGAEALRTWCIRKNITCVRDNDFLLLTGMLGVIVPAAEKCQLVGGEGWERSGKFGCGLASDHRAPP